MLTKKEIYDEAFKEFDKTLDLYTELLKKEV